MNNRYTSDISCCIFYHQLTFYSRQKSEPLQTVNFNYILKTFWLSFFEFQIKLSSRQKKERLQNVQQSQLMNPSRPTLDEYPDEFQYDENVKSFACHSQTVSRLHVQETPPGPVLETPLDWDWCHVRETVWKFKNNHSGQTPKFDLENMAKLSTLDILWMALLQTVSRQRPERAVSDPHVGRVNRVFHLPLD